MKLRALDISEVNSYIKRILTNDPILYNLRVKGEISNFKVHSSGNVYLIHRSHDFQSPAGALLDQPAQIGEAQHGAVLRLKGLVAAIHEIAVLGVYSDERCDVLPALECARPVGRRRFHFDGILWSAAFFDDEC